MATHFRMEHTLDWSDTNTLLASLVEKMEQQQRKSKPSVELGRRKDVDYHKGKIVGIDQCITIIKEAMK